MRGTRMFMSDIDIEGGRTRLENLAEILRKLTGRFSGGDRGPAPVPCNHPLFFIGIREERASSARDMDNGEIAGIPARVRRGRPGDGSTTSSRSGTTPGNARAGQGRCMSTFETKRAARNAGAGRG